MTAVLPLVFAEFFVPGVAVGKQRQRSNFNGHGARLYTPAKTVNYEATVRMAASSAMVGRDLAIDPVDVWMEIYCPIAPSWSKKKQALARAGEIYPGSKPDVDNVTKAVFDGMNGVVWRDDVLVATAFVRKRYADIPGVRVIVYPGGALGEPSVLTTSGILA